MISVEVPALRRLIRSFEVRMKVKELAEACGGRVVRGPDDRMVDGLSYDSRTTRRNDLFFAVQGFTSHGSAYVADALTRGAAAVISDRELDLPHEVPLVLVENGRRAKALAASCFFGRPSTRLRCIGVTGTNGKTTTTYMLKSILEQHGFSTGMIGTIRHLVGRRQVTAANTTPDAVDIQRYLAEMVDENQDAAVLEVSSHALVQARTMGVRFRVGIFTNLSQDHLDFHETMENYAAAKAMLFSSLEPDATGVINNDDHEAARMAKACRCPVLTYGLGEEASVQGIIRRLDSDGFSMNLKTPIGETVVSSRLLGRHNVYNALAASTAAVALDLPLSAIRTGIEVLTSIPGRVESVDAGQDFRVIVDYAHTDDALKNLLENLRPLATRLISVFGCGGDRDAFNRPLMARVATTLSDFTVVTSDNPRSEDARSIIDDIVAGCVPGADVMVEPDRRSAIEAAIREARGGDIVVIAGKGHEDYQILNSGIIEFDDRQVAREILWNL